MSIIKNPAEIVGKKTISALIYGQSGMGKTTLACSAPAPVLFDFDNGIGRIDDAYMCPVVPVSSWEDATSALEEVIQSDDFKTIIIDTASKMIDCITTSVCGGSVPSIRQWSTINAKFNAFRREVAATCLNIVYIAQREVEKNGEDIRYIPQFRQSNYKDVVCDLDIVGYMEVVADRGQHVRRITFDPTPRNEGKNTAGFASSYIIPTLSAGSSNNFLSARFSEFSKRQSERDRKRAEVAAKVAEQYDQYKAFVDGSDTVEAFNDIVAKIRTVTPLGDLYARLRKLVTATATARGYSFNSETKRYE